MANKISYIIKILIIHLILMSNSIALELPIIPLKKPILDKAQIEEKINKSVLKPKSKPNKKKIEEIKIVEKEKSKIKFLLPKNKPVTVKKEVIKIQKTSKYSKKKTMIWPTDLFKHLKKGNGLMLYL